MNTPAPIQHQSAGRPTLHYLAVLVTLCAVTYLVLLSSWRYAPAPLEGAAGLEAPLAPPGDLRDWRRSPGGIILNETSAEPSASLAPRDLARRQGGISMLRASFAIPEGTEAVRLEFRAGAEGLSEGEEAWQAGRVQLLSFDRDGQFVWYWPKDVYRVSGDQPLKPVSALVPVKPQIKAAMIVIYNGADSGVLRIGPVAATHMVERPIFAGLRLGLVLAWVLAGLWIARAVLQRAESWPLGAFLLGAILLALAAVLTPQPVFREVTAPIQAWAVSLANQVLSPVPEMAPTPPGVEMGRQGTDRAPSQKQPAPDAGAAGTAVQKGGGSPGRSPDSGQVLVVPSPQPDYVFSFKQLSHFAMFVLIGLSGFLAFPQAPWLGRLACLAGVAVVTECLQWFVVTRSAQLSDLVADLAGLALAAALAPAAAGLFARIRRRTWPSLGKSGTP